MSTAVRKLVCDLVTAEISTDPDAFEDAISVYGADIEESYDLLEEQQCPKNPSGHQFTVTCGNVGYIHCGARA